MGSTGASDRLCDLDDQTRLGTQSVGAWIEGGGGGEQCYVEMDGIVQTLDQLDLYQESRPQSVSTSRQLLGQSINQSRGLEWLFHWVLGWNRHVILTALERSNCATTLMH
jgi:hypothetical protein